MQTPARCTCYWLACTGNGNGSTFHGRLWCPCAPILKFPLSDVENQRAQWLAWSLLNPLDGLNCKRGQGEVHKRCSETLLKWLDKVSDEAVGIMALEVADWTVQSSGSRPWYGSLETLARRVNKCVSPRSITEELQCHARCPGNWVVVSYGAIITRHHEMTD